MPSGYLHPSSHNKIRQAQGGLAIWITGTFTAGLARQLLQRARTNGSVWVVLDFCKINNQCCSHFVCLLSENNKSKGL
ncbi:hypothetical protein ATANTOWER_027386 [Ataeniobius toweri]|uniref:Uncharacterized protein n=1 Tax=Ataeniobius toweri TaxID=208326 RepID=A0ABU7C0S3_9TELE|nr:hypothetical protein [Ataeniobius toweri]